MSPAKKVVFISTKILFYSAKLSQQINFNLKLFYFFSQLEKQWFKQDLSSLAEGAWIVPTHQNSEWQIFNL